jgi:hypothetical protein
MTSDKTTEQDESKTAAEAVAPDEAALWAELEASEAATGAGDQPSDKDRDDAGFKDEADAGEQGTDGAATAEGGTAANADTKADKAASGAKAPDAGKPAAKDQADVWASAPPELRTAHEAVQTEFTQYKRSNEGRIAAFQRRTTELESRLGAQQNVSREASGGAGGKPKDSAFLASEGWKKFKEEYGEVAAPLEGVIGEMQTEIERLKGGFTAIDTDRRDTALSKNEAIVADKHSDWQVVVDQNHEAFVEWVNQQPRMYREAVVRNQTQIVDPAEVIKIVGDFKAHLGIEVSSTGGSEGQTGADERRESGNGNQKDQLSDKRKRQLDSAAGGKAKGPGTAQGIPEEGDPEMLWKQMEKAGL